MLICTNKKKMRMDHVALQMVQFKGWISLIEGKLLMSEAPHL